MGQIPEDKARTLDSDAKREIDRILDETIENPIGPEFMAPPAAPTVRAVA
jgi:hypothetical protein